MRITCIGEGALMQETIPRLMSNGYDVSYCSRCAATIEQINFPSTPQSALPQSIFESDCVLIFLDDCGNSEYILGRDALASLSNHSVILIHQENANTAQLQKQLANARTDCFSLVKANNEIKVKARTNQLEKWNSLIKDISQSRSSIGTSTKIPENVVAGPWVTQSNSSQGSHNKVKEIN